MLLLYVEDTHFNDVNIKCDVFCDLDFGISKEKPAEKDICFYVFSVYFHECQSQGTFNNVKLA